MTHECCNGEINTIMEPFLSYLWSFSKLNCDPLDAVCNLHGCLPYSPVCKWCKIIKIWVLNRVGQCDSRGEVRDRHPF